MNWLSIIVFFVFVIFISFGGGFYLYPKAKQKQSQLQQEKKKVTTNEESLNTALAVTQEVKCLIDKTFFSSISDQ